MTKWLAAVAVVLLPLTALADSLRVAAAISMKEPLELIAKNFEIKTGTKIETSLGASGQLAQQITSGAPIDVFISAAAKQVDELDKAALLVPGTRSVIATNTLVLITPARNGRLPTKFDDLASVMKIAIGEPKTVPAGEYAMQVLSKLNLADKLEGKLVYGANVRQVLNYVERDEVQAGIVYATDAKQSGEKVQIVATADPKWHSPIVYPAAVVAASKQKETAQQFVEFLRSPESIKHLTDAGFGVPAPAATQP